MHPGVSISIGDEDVAVRTHGRIGGMVERLGPPGAVPHTNHELNISMRVESEDTMRISVDDEYEVRIRDADAVRVINDSAAPAADELSASVEHDYGWVGSLNNVYIALRVNRDLANGLQSLVCRHSSPGPLYRISVVSDPNPQVGHVASQLGDLRLVVTTDALAGHELIPHDRPGVKFHKRPIDHAVGIC
jgi:hypothetical protein